MRLPISAALVGLVAGLPSAHADTSTDPAAAPASATTTAQAPTDIPLEDVQAFVAVYRAVKRAYVDPVDDHRLMNQAIRGLLTGLDPHSEFLDAKGLSNLDQETSGAYAGLGVEVVMVDGAMRVVSPIDDTPASRAGIKSGDIIARIDGELVTADNGSESIDKLRGAPGSTIKLSVLREGLNTPMELSLIRERIRVASVKGNLLEPGYAYVRIAQFQQDTGNELRERLRKLASSKPPLRGLVFDLRSNPGGVLNAAIDVSDSFLDSGTIVSTRGRYPDPGSQFSAVAGDLLNGAPIVVLVDGGTASAAEIVAGALKDNHRALIVGSRTFGKGSVQSVLPLSNGDAVKLTTQRYFTPSGASIQARGIEPDIALADLRLSRPDSPASATLAERDLAHHLKGDKNDAAPADDVIDHSAYADDYGLNEALNVLKGLALARERTRSATAQG